MQHNVRIQPAVLADEWAEVVALCRRVSSVASHIQIDVADTHFAPRATFPFNATTLSEKELPDFERIVYEVHLMVRHPQELGEVFVRAGCRSVVAQVEGFENSDEIYRALTAWRTSGAEQVGLSLMLETSLETVMPFIDEHSIDTVQVMSIQNIGVQGGAFDDSALVRISALRRSFAHGTIEVDGGVTAEVLHDIALAGADVANVGSAIFGAEDAIEAYRHLVAHTT